MFTADCFYYLQLQTAAESSAMADLNIITCLVILLPLRLAIDFPLIITSGLFIINKIDLVLLSWILST